MHRATAISMLALFLIGALLPVQFKEELGKLPSLLEHYREHRLETPQLSFLRFLQIHYGKEFTNHRGAHDHSDLPMKSSCDHVHIATPLALPGMALAYAAPASVVARQLHIRRQSYYFMLLHDIWQPPQA